MSTLGHHNAVFVSIVVGLDQPSHSFLWGRCPAGMANHSWHAAVRAATPFRLIVAKRGGNAASVSVLWWVV